jgi:hypothetical protein
MTRELWFENTRDSLISSVNGDRKVVIQRIHDTADLAKFACQISPAVLPGESAVVGYICEGGRFVRDHFCRQTMPRYTRHMTMNLRHCKAGFSLNAPRRRSIQTDRRILQRKDFSGTTTGQT